MTLIHRCLIVFFCVMIGLHCGEPVTDTSYRGDALFSFEGQVDVLAQFSPGDHSIRLSIFWLPKGGDTPVDQWLEQSSTSMSIEFPSSFKVRIFHPPEPKHYFHSQALGRFMLYDDLNKNGAKDADEPFVGTSTNQGILYLPDEEAAKKNILGLDFKPGFTLVHYPIRCFERVPRANDLLCMVPIGQACNVKDDCCAANIDCETTAVACLKDLSGQRVFPGGYCTVRDTRNACRSADTQATDNAGFLSRMVSFNLIAGAAQVVLKVCEADSECREGYVCEPAYRVCLPTRAVKLSMSPDYVFESICVQSDVMP